MVFELTLWIKCNDYKLADFIQLYALRVFMVQMSTEPCASYFCLILGGYALINDENELNE